MSENRLASTIANSPSIWPTRAPTQAGPSVVACTLLLGLLCQPLAALEDGYVAPARAPQAWLDRLTSEDRRPLEEWITFLPPRFDERLRWFDPNAQSRALAAPHWSDWYGKVIVVQSWTHTDENAQRRLDETAEVVKEFAEIDVQFVVLHTPADATRAWSYLREQNWTHLTAIDVTGDFCDLLGVYRTPVNLVIGRNGAVRYAGLHADGLRVAIDHLLDEDAHAAPCRGSRPIAAGSSVLRGGGFPPHNPQPRAQNLQGQVAPEFFVQSWANHEPDQIEGRVNVIKFWRTNCPHCINAIPKTSQLAQKYAGRVNFIDITHENENALEQGLTQRRHPLDTISHPIAIDTSSRMRSVVGSQVVPNAMIIDSNWIVRWQGNPAAITEQMLDRILAADGAGGETEIVRRWGSPEAVVAAAGQVRPLEAQRLAQPPRLGPTAQAQQQQQPARQVDGQGGYPPHNPQPRARNLQGQPAPEFVVESWANHEPDQIEGRVNVVKFWRTNCPHCIDAIPKTSETARKYAGRVNFIDITHENQAALEQGLAQRRVSLDSISQSIAIDTRSRMQQAVGSQGVPNAIVFDKNWIVRWQGHPAQITEQMLDQILAADAQAPDQPRAAQPTAPRVEVHPASTRRRIEFGPAEFPPVTGEAGATVDFRGKPGPEFHVQQWVTAQPMRVGGKVTVIEFFRTSCPHCRRAIDKLNDYNVQFGGVVDFITVSNENESVFTSGLAQHQLSTRSFNHFVALDPSQKMQKAVNPRGVPHAIVLDSDWIVRWQGNPHSLTGEILEQIVKADAWKRRQGNS